MEQPVNEAVEHKGSVNDMLNRSQEERRNKLIRKMGLVGAALMPIGIAGAIAGFLTGMHAIGLTAGVIGGAGFLLRLPFMSQYINAYNEIKKRERQGNT